MTTVEEKVARQTSVLPKLAVQVVLLLVVWIEVVFTVWGWAKAGDPSGWMGCFGFFIGIIPPFIWLLDCSNKFPNKWAFDPVTLSIQGFVLFLPFSTSFSFSESEKYSFVADGKTTRQDEEIWALPWHVVRLNRIAAFTDTRITTTKDGRKVRVAYQANLSFDWDHEAALRLAGTKNPEELIKTHAQVAVARQINQVVGGLSLTEVRVPSKSSGEHHVYNPGLKVQYDAGHTATDAELDKLGVTWTGFVEVTDLALYFGPPERK